MEKAREYGDRIENLDVQAYYVVSVIRYNSCETQEYCVSMTFGEIMFFVNIMRLDRQTESIVVQRVSINTENAVEIGMPYAWLNGKRILG